MWQSLVILVVLALVLAYIVRHLSRAYRSGTSPCSGCCGCCAADGGTTPGPEDASRHGSSPEVPCAECEGGTERFRSGSKPPLR
ncbi:MAG TPA: hypothetical protein PK250_13710 [Syntrophobacter fumaroxidans]|nr:hypothetical protein [Syntrophobacter fumaroxidans]